MGEAETQLKRYMSVADLARYLGRNRDTIFEWVKDGKLPPRILLGKRLVWFGPAIQDWERELTAGSKKP